jgi:WD40 repeat protein
LLPLTPSLQSIEALLRTLEGHAGRVSALAVLADGRLASGSDDNTIKLWNPASGACEATLEGHADTVTALAVLADGRLASGSADSTIKLWNPASGACEATLEGHSSTVFELAVLADGRLASGSWDHTVRIWEARNSRLTGAVQFVADSGVTALAFAPHASVLAAGDASGRVHFLKIEGSLSVAGRTLRR